MKRDLELRQIDPLEAEMRNAVLNSEIEGLEITRLQTDIRYVSLIARCDQHTHRAFISLQQLIDYWLGDASIPAEQVATDIVSRFLADEFSTRGLPSPCEPFLWQTIAGFASDEDFISPVVKMSNEPFDIYLQRLPEAFNAAPRIPPELPVNTQWMLGAVTLSASALAEVAPGDVLQLAQRYGTLSAAGAPLFSFHFQGDFLMLEDIHNEYAEGTPLSDEPSTVPTSGIVLEDLPVTVSFVLSKRTMRVAEVGSLQPGTTVPLEILSPKVDVIAGGALLAQGELVRLGETLGVEITKTNRLVPGKLVDSTS